MRAVIPEPAENQVGEAVVAPGQTLRSHPGLWGQKPWGGCLAANVQSPPGGSGAPLGLRPASLEFEEDGPTVAVVRDLKNIPII